MTARAASSRRHGFTIIEVLVASAMLIIAVTATASAYEMFARSLRMQDDVATATHICEVNMEQIVSRGRDPLVAQVGSTPNLFWPSDGSDYLWMQYDKRGRLLHNYPLPNSFFIAPTTLFRTRFTVRAGPLVDTQLAVFSVYWPRSGTWATNPNGPFHQVSFSTFIN